jgi:hypothetical protein
MKMSRHALTLLTNRRGARFEEGICKEKPGSLMVVTPARFELALPA